MPADQALLEAKLLITHIRPAEQAIQNASLQARNAGFNKAVTSCGTLRICLTDLSPNPCMNIARAWVETISFQQLLVELLTRLQIQLLKHDSSTSAVNKHLESARRRIIRATPVNMEPSTIHHVRASPMPLGTLQEIWNMAQHEGWADYDSEMQLP